MDAMRPRIVVMHLVEASGGGEGIFGKERAILALMRAQRAAGDMLPRLATFSPGDLASAASGEGFTVDVLGHSERTLPFAALRSLRRALAGTPPATVLHTHGYKANIVGRLLRASGGHVAALVSTCHGFVNTTMNLRAYNALDRFTGGMSDAVTAPDPGMLRNFGPGSRTVFIPNAVADLPVSDGAARAAARRSFGWTDGMFVAGVLGRLSHEKGVGNLLSAATASASVPQLRWAIAGSGPLEALVRDAALPSLQYLGFLDDALPYLSALDVYVQPSFTEGLSISLLEAMRFALPIVATDVGATSEAVRHESEALLVKAEPGAIADAVLRLQGDPALGARLGGAARQRFYDLFRMELIERRYAQLYREAIARRDAGSKGAA